MKLGLYKHYKGNLYQVFGVCRHSETLEEMVMYQALYGDYGFWVRPKNLFEEKIVVDNREVSRFTYVSELFIKAPKIR